MPNMIKRSVTHGFFSRVRNSLVGAIVGMVFIPGSMLVLGWNEYRTIHRTRGLLEAEQVVLEIPDPSQATDSSNSQLVHFTGKAVTDELLVDTDFAVSLPVLRLERRVEMFQWVERKESNTRNKVGGGSETITTYHYDEKWETDRVDSDRFKERSGHENPTLRYASQVHNAQKATVGAYHLRPDLVNDINTWQVVPNDQVPISEMSSDLQSHLVDDGHYIYYSPTHPDPAHPKIGDHRIRFRKVDPTEVSLLSMQDGKNLKPFNTSNGEKVEQLQVGQVTAAAMFESLKSRNAMIAWLLRTLGWGASVVGFMLITGPLKSLANVIPMLGNLVGTATFAISLLLGSCISLTVIAIAWIAVRPFFGISVLLIVGALLYLLTRSKKPPVAVGPPPLPN
jgi:environmental stress-induced protein Ves